MRWFYHNRYFIGIIFFLLVAFFFYPVFKGFIPFPGDLLVSEVQPYRSFGHLGYAPGGVPSKAQGPDVIRQLFPWKNFAIESYKNYELPLWNPYNFAGNPLAANFQSGVFYPLNSVFLLSDFPSGWTIFIFLIPFLSCAFTYLFLRELNLSKLAAFFGGVVFAFSSYMVVWLEWGNIGHTLLWLPLALFFTERFLKKPAFSKLLLLISALTFSCLAGYIQGYFYVTATVLFYFFTKHLLSRSLSFKQTGIFIIGLVVPLLLTAFQLLPTLELFELSSRSSYSLNQIGRLLNPQPLP